MNGQQKGGANQDIFITFLDLNIVSNPSPLLLCKSLSNWQLHDFCNISPAVLFLTCTPQFIKYVFWNLDVVRT